MHPYSTFYELLCTFCIQNAIVFTIFLLQVAKNYCFFTLQLFLKNNAGICWSEIILSIFGGIVLLQSSCNNEHDKSQNAHLLEMQTTPPPPILPIIADWYVCGKGHLSFFWPQSIEHAGLEPSIMLNFKEYLWAQYGVQRHSSK